MIPKLINLKGFQNCEDEHYEKTALADRIRGFDWGKSNLSRVLERLDYVCIADLARLWFPVPGACNVVSYGVGHTVRNFFVDVTSDRQSQRLD